jgi:1,4-alpha-glucan branching enzyme
MLQEMNTATYGAHPGIMTVAEESTAFPGVSRPCPTAASASASSGTWAG